MPTGRYSLSEIDSAAQQPKSTGVFRLSDISESAPTPPQQPEEKSLSGFAKNILPSAGRFVGGLASAAVHPINTGEALLKTATGTFQAMSPETPASAQTGVGKEYVPYVKAAGEALKQRYGSLEAIKNTLYEDPVGAAADVSGMASGVSGVLRGAGGVARLSGAGKTASALSKAADAANTVSRVTNPMTPISGAAKMAARAAGKAGSELLGMTTGAGGEAIRTAAKNPTPQFKAAMRGGISETDTVSSFKGALQNVRDQRRDQYVQRLQKISQQNIPPIDLTPVRQDMLNKLNAFGARVTPQGLDLSRVPIANPSERRIFENVVADVLNWGSQPGDLTPLGVDVLKRRIDDFYSESSQARAFVQGMKKSVQNVLDTNVPGYREMTKDYAQASDFIKKIEQELSLGKGAQTGTAIRKLSYALKQNNEYRRVLTEALEQYTQEDLKGQLAGHHLSRVAPRGISSALTGSGILGALATGMVQPEYAVSLMLASPRAMGEVMAAMNKTKKLAKVGGRITVDPALYGAARAGQAIAAGVPKVESPEQ